MAQVVNVTDRPSPAGPKMAIQPVSSGTTTRNLLTCGMVAGPLFVGVALVEILTVPGFDITRHPISVLELGTYGWVQIANILVSGAFFVALRHGTPVRPPWPTWGHLGTTAVGHLRSGSVPSGHLPHRSDRWVSAGHTLGHPHGVQHVRCHAQCSQHPRLFGRDRRLLCSRARLCQIRPAACGDWLAGSWGGIRDHAGRSPVGRPSRVSRLVCRSLVRFDRGLSRRRSLADGRPDVALSSL